MAARNEPFMYVHITVLSSNMVLSITARLDELKANIMETTSVFSDSKTWGIDELFEWLHAVASATSRGPVLLVLTFADCVSSQVECGLLSLLLCTIYSPLD